MMCSKKIAGSCALAVIVIAVLLQDQIADWVEIYHQNKEVDDHKHFYCGQLQSKGCNITTWDDDNLFLAYDVNTGVTSPSDVVDHLRGVCDASCVVQSGRRLDDRPKHGGAWYLIKVKFPKGTNRGHIHIRGGATAIKVVDVSGDLEIWKDRQNTAIWNQLWFDKHSKRKNIEFTLHAYVENTEYLGGPEIHYNARTQKGKTEFVYADHMKDHAGTVLNKCNMPDGPYKATYEIKRWWARCETWVKPVNRVSRQKPTEQISITQQLKDLGKL